MYIKYLYTAIASQSDNCATLNSSCNSERQYTPAKNSEETYAQQLCRG